MNGCALGAILGSFDVVLHVYACVQLSMVCVCVDVYVGFGNWRSFCMFMTVYFFMKIVFLSGSLCRALKFWCQRSAIQQWIVFWSIWQRQCATAVLSVAL